MIFNTTGGGGTPLNFKVVGGTTAPTSPKENTIWVNTSVTIPSWAFSATEPKSPTEGMVWISTGTSSTAAFNALKKNDIQLYPLNAKQYVGGEWSDVQAKTYQDGEWVDWFDGQIYDSGTVYTEAGIHVLPDTSAVAYYNSYIYTGTTAKKVSEAFAVFGPVDLTDFDAIVMVAKFTDDNANGTSHNHVLYVAKGRDASYTDAVAIEKVNKTSGITSQTTVTLDVSGLTGLYYVFAGQHTNGSAWEAKRTQQIASVKAERGATAQYANLINQLSEVPLT